MYVVRVHFKNGLLLSYVYRDMGKAKQCADICATGREAGSRIPPAPAGCHIFDEAGREAWLDGTMMQAVQFVDVGEEVVGDTRLRLTAGNIERQLLDRASGDAAPSFDPNNPPLSGQARTAPPRAPAIVPMGMGVRFAS